MGHRRILFVHGLDPDCRARDVAYEFERYGRIVRCDIPAQRPGVSPYAFVEFEVARDAEDAYYELHGKRFPGGVLKIQWAKRPPRRFDEHSGRDGGREGERVVRRGRSRSPDRQSSGDKNRPESAESRNRAVNENSTTIRNGVVRSPSPPRRSPAAAVGSEKNSSTGRSPTPGSEEISTMETA